MASIRNLILALGCAVVMIAAMKPAAATTMSYDVVFSADNFVSTPPGTTPPIDLVLGQFHVAFDPTVGGGGPLGYDFILPVSLDGPMNFFYTVATDTLEVFDFTNSLYIQNFTTGPVLQVLIYESGGTSFHSNHGLVHVTATAIASTPIPAALPLFGAALGGLGFAAWRRRRSLGTAAA